tara:strand:- start:226 stop:438 length:213 start_codon:yes stop_codon:yes gene_type:complete
VFTQVVVAVEQELQDQPHQEDQEVVEVEQLVQVQVHQEQQDVLTLVVVAVVVVTDLAQVFQFTEELVVQE